MTPDQLQNDPLQNVHNPLKVMQPGERVICEIKRHPFGLLGMYVVFLAVLIVAISGVILAPHLITGLSSQNREAIALGALLVCALTGLFTYIGVAVYKGNRWIVTSDSITQVTQVSLFNKQTSQLSLANLEDVTVEQNGILQSMFGFGRLKAESAGERGKFVFDFCPNPNEYARQVIAAHEAYIAHKPEEMHISNQALANTTSFNQSYEQQTPASYSNQVPPTPYMPPAPAQQPYSNPQSYESPQPAPPQQPYASTQGYGQPEPQQQTPDQGNQWPQNPNGQA
ncbi:MAG TPA: PH domain-containing protein [Verrucomicrobiae bacterium]|nr:PH domain-containing protein [Verrucomicrobiae bacterium]